VGKTATGGEQAWEARVAGREKYLYKRMEWQRQGQISEVRVEAQVEVRERGREAGE